jgi:hypothetical protein
VNLFDRITKRTYACYLGKDGKARHKELETAILASEKPVEVVVNDRKYLKTGYVTTRRKGLMLGISLALAVWGFEYLYA